MGIYAELRGFVLTHRSCGVLRGNRDDEREREERGESEALFHGHVGGRTPRSPWVPAAPGASSGRGIQRGRV